MKQPLLLSVSLLFSLIFMFHSVNSFDNSYDEKSYLDQNECPSLKKITAPSGFIRFPIMTKEYKNNLHCRWLIVAPPGKVIRLEVTWHDFADNDHCPTCCPDFLDIFDGRNESAPLVTRLCGATEDGAPSKMFRTTSSKTLLVFVSDGKEGDDGFLLKYEIIPRNNAPSESECGIPDIDFKPRVDSRIVGGVEATPHSWPWQARIEIRLYPGDGWWHHCGGSVLNSRWVITAAHCFQMGGPEDYKVVLGEHRRSHNEGTEQVFEIKKLIMHEDYKIKTLKNDIALIRLQKDIRFNRYVKPICLPDDDVKDGELCVTTGWGNTSFTGDERVLNQVYLPVISNKICNQPDWYGGSVTDSMICAGYENGGKSTCNGDSGGPLACLPDRTRKWTLFGLTSWSKRGCAKRRSPSVYTRVMKYIGWIRENIGQYDY